MAAAGRAKAYLALRALGRGAHARVTLALHARTGTKVLVRGVRKAELPDLRLLAREMGCMKALHHPNIVELFEVVDTGRELQLVMEYVPGRDLQDHLAERGRLEEAEARRLFGQMLAALSHCHAKGVAHLDVRPENILLTPEGQVKLADFGLSVQGFNRRLSACCCGPDHRAPEVYLGQQYSGPKVDVWSLGVVLYQMVTGALPFRGAGPGETRERVLGGHVRLPAYLSAPCRDLLAAMLARDPQSRSTLDGVQQHPWVQGGPPPPPPAREPPLCPQDPAITRAMERLGYQRQEIREAIEERKYDDVMGTYLILRARRRAGEEEPEEEDGGERPRRVTFLVPGADPDPDARDGAPQPEAARSARRPSILRKQAAAGRSDGLDGAPERPDARDPERSRPAELGPPLRDAWEDGAARAAGPRREEPGEHGGAPPASAPPPQGAGEPRGAAGRGPQPGDAGEHGAAPATGAPLDRAREGGAEALGPAPAAPGAGPRPPRGCGRRGAELGGPGRGAGAVHRALGRIAACCCCCCCALRLQRDGP